MRSTLIIPILLLLAAAPVRAGDLADFALVSIGIRDVPGDELAPGVPANMQKDVVITFANAGTQSATGSVGVTYETGSTHDLLKRLYDIPLRSLGYEVVTLAAGETGTRTWRWEGDLVSMVWDADHGYTEFCGFAYARADADHGNSERCATTWTYGPPTVALQ